MMDFEYCGINVFPDEGVESEQGEELQVARWLLFWICVLDLGIHERIPYFEEIFCEEVLGDGFVVDLDSFSDALYMR